MPNTWKGKLRGLVPKAGMKYQSDSRLMHHTRRDKRVADALRAAGYEMEHPAITQVLVNLFRTATPLVTEGRANQKDLWESLSLVQLQIDWARGLPGPIFFELFVCFVEARHMWEKEPDDPFYRYEPHNPAVLELITFRESVGNYHADGTSWVLTEAIWFNELARGYDEDEDVAMGDSDCIINEYQDINEDRIVDGVNPPLEQRNIETGEGIQRALCQFLRFREGRAYRTGIGA
ncbi:hypothetical protein F5Y10DRAFT_283480 [Nemania abortiva]|nr:hypothetical protein F5Y10DRAFT_283480 [Nemania abortiva]